MIAIPNMKKPKRCDECWALDDNGDYPMCLITQEQRGYDFNIRTRVMDFCPLIEIDHTNTELLEFFNEFKKWKASKEVAKYINAVYGERRADE